MATLEQVIQQMIDDGKSEADITAFVEQVKAARKPKAPVDGGPEDYWSGFLQGGLEGASKGALGFVKGILPGVGEGALGLITLPIAILKEMLSTADGLVRFKENPTGTMASIFEAMKKVPGQTTDSVKAAMKMAASDPEAFGNAVGHLTGNAEVGIAAAAAVPLLPKPLAKQIGTAAETFGKKASWPLRITGAHQIIGGNVLGGIATMSAPQMLESGGGALREWGSPTPNPSGARTLDVGPVKTPAIRVQARPAPAISSERIPYRGLEAATEPLDQAAIGRVQTDIEKNLSKSIDKMGNPAKEGLKDVDAAIAAEKKNAQGVRIASAKREAGLQADKAIQDQITKGGLVPGDPRITEMVKAPGRTMTTSYGPAEEAATAPTAGGGAAPTGPLTPWEQEMLRRSGGRPGSGGVSARTGQIVRPVPATQPLAAPESASALPDPSALPRATAAPTEPPSVSAPDPGALPAGALEAPLGVPASRSSRAQSSMAGISANDLEALKQILTENPEFTAEQAAQELVTQRAQRQQMYKDTAGLSKLEKAALDRDTE